MVNMEHGCKQDVCQRGPRSRKGQHPIDNPLVHSFDETIQRLGGNLNTITIYVFLIISIIQVRMVGTLLASFDVVVF